MAAVESSTELMSTGPTVAATTIAATASSVASNGTAIATLAPNMTECKFGLFHDYQVNSLVVCLLVSSDKMLVCPLRFLLNYKKETDQQTDKRANCH